MQELTSQGTAGASAQQAQQLIASYTGKLLRETFGKGPESVYVSLGQTYFTIYLRNFLSPSERVLLDQDHDRIIHQMRDRLMDNIIPEISTYMSIVTGVKPREFYYDWNLNNRSGMIMGMTSEPFPDTSALCEHYEGREGLEVEIVKISQQAQKAPEEVYSCEINPRTLIVLRNGILVRIEKEFIRLGHGDMLRTVKRQLEKSYMHNNSAFESLLQKSVIDSFVDWNYQLDKSMMVFVLNPKHPPGGNVLDMVDMSQS
ncbi:Na-translocating system protein MpsC family protein [Paenibacillus silviterrae]|uniref:Na-translocating system protein MpsC family protein n=1 Tax=Paenibacillus silviterrae TaxID=3242194 RepID=UPI002542AB61|nr:Na-translocating system protein MpsC family protein [Paenibacillus chinjuensis]